MKSLTILTPQILFFLETMLLVSVIFMHIAKKNFTIILLYTAQSLIITIALFSSALKEASLLLMAVALATFLLKVVIAPRFFLGLMKKHQVQFSVSTYLNTPMSLIVLAFLIMFSHSHFFRPLTILAVHNEASLLLAMAMINISIFLIVNRKGVLSQMVGILSLENAIVSFAYISRLEAAPDAQIGILFAIVVWIVIASSFASMIYWHFGSLDTSAMRHLKEE